MTPVLAALLLGMTVSLLVWGGWRTLGPEGFLKKKRILQERIDSLSFGNTGTLPPHLEKTYHLSDVGALKKILSRYGFSIRLAELLKRARLKVTVSIFLMSCLILGGCAFIILRIFLGFFVSVLLACGVPLLPFLYLRFCNKRYLSKFMEYFPDSLSIMSGAIKAGHSLESAVEAVSKNSPYPVSQEFKAVVVEMKFGQPLQAALQSLYQRIKINELKIFVTGVTVQQELGGNLSEILDNLEKTVRERFALQREVKVLSAQGILTSRVLLAIPYVILFILMSPLSPDPSMVTEFFTSPGGKMAIPLILGMQIAAFLWMQRVIQLKD